MASDVPPTAVTQGEPVPGPERAVGYVVERPGPGQPVQGRVHEAELPAGLLGGVSLEAGE